MQLTIYVPDTMGETVRAMKGINVSKICQDALKREIDRYSTLDKLVDRVVDLLKIDPKSVVVDLQDGRVCLSANDLQQLLALVNVA